MCRPTKMPDILIINMWKHSWIQKIGQYRKIPPPQSGKKWENSSTEIMAEDTEVHDEPPKQITKTVKKGAKSLAKGQTMKKT